VVRPECFSAEEIALYSVACPTRPKNVAEKARNWVKTTGGIGGVARGIHANHLPPERVRARVEGLLRD
jgi:hypothetical protein